MRVMFTNLANCGAPPCTGLNHPDFPVQSSWHFLCLQVALHDVKAPRIGVDAQMSMEHVDIHQFFGVS